MKRAELIKALGRLKVETGSIACLGCGHEHNCTTQGCALIRAAIEELEHADVRPVVRGRWEVVDWVEYDGHGECVHYPKEGLRCTNCKNAFKMKLLWKDNYCPNCGADMREA